MMENTQENNPTTNPLTMESTVEAILERARDDWGAMNAWNFFSIYYGNPYGMHRHTAVTMQQYLENPEKFVPDAAKREYIQFGLNLKRALMQRHLQRDLDRLKVANIVSLEDWKRLGATVDMGPMARMVLTRAFKQAMHHSPPKATLKKTPNEKEERGM
ncbi:unnamed protein product [Trypanosoma congolense IL3000]|uniref:WGS project CAEQ00000000 data, annotated contig 1053 n=1 Tax=Trypanosoma congolense (strain IL3000) TaxID=1068625 RepID=F9W3H5_TRYCI|nr:unnamed protein product [Trypanosoma congolense IL3000]